MRLSSPRGGRERQRRRTRSALLAAATRLVAGGRTPTISEVADAAEVSRRTAYRHFPTQEQLLVEATLEALRPVMEPSLGDDGPADGSREALETRLDRAVRGIQRTAVANEQLLRAMIRLTVSKAGSGRRLPRRGYRRIEWMDRALAPLRTRLGKRRFDRLISGVILCVGIEALLVLRDLRGLSVREAEGVSR